MTSEQIRDLVARLLDEERTRTEIAEKAKI